MRLQPIELVIDVSVAVQQRRRPGIEQQVQRPSPGFHPQPLDCIDFPVGAETSRLVDTLNELVIALEGRIYLAKDAFTRREHFESMEGERLERFRAARKRWDPDRKIRSRQSERLGL